MLSFVIIYLRIQYSLDSLYFRHLFKSSSETFSKHHVTSIVLNLCKVIVEFSANRGGCYHIYASLISYLSIAEVVTLTRTCKKLSNLYRELLRSLWDVDRDLRQFVKNPYEFRAQLGRQDALVSGQFAHQFFNRKFSQMRISREYLKRMFLFILRIAPVMLMPTHLYDTYFWQKGTKLLVQNR